MQIKKLLEIESIIGGSQNTLRYGYTKLTQFTIDGGRNKIS